MKEHYKGIGHIAIYTVDMDQSIAFYEMIGGSVFKRDGVETPEGLKKLALVEFGGFLLELIEPPAGTLVPSGEGSIPHFAVYVDDLDKTAADLKAAGVISFTAPEKKVLPNTFGGLQNWFFTGPSGEQIDFQKRAASPLSKDAVAGADGSRACIRCVGNIHAVLLFVFFEKGFQCG